MKRAADIADPAGDIERGEYHRYVLAFGSNQRVPAIGGPREVIRSAIGDLEDCGLHFLATSRLIQSVPVGPSQRRYINGAALVETFRAPPAMLMLGQAIEKGLGRRRRGMRWRSRTIDIDIVLWSGGMFAVPDLLIPHPMFRTRNFVLGPASEIAPGWRDPITGLTLRQMRARLMKSAPKV